ncbi:hypothetical protein CAEBREN_19941 [Caenorhabditis brenneri]|uniref:Serpentine Receptor, class H n=1 Tax=Caenorhabditis brenneri TaxID=135651 RepID=G0NHX5_CAEBE|nr:hypothetical protein CAEBREN_19941 [Caenorhabditis brenneri]
MINCNSTTFFNTAQFLTYFLHCFGCFAIPIHIFGGYCILYKTPVTMASVKWCLFSFHCWSCFMDLGLSLLTTPYLFLPALAGTTVGVLNLTGLGMGEQAFLMMATVGIVIVSVIVIFEKRLFILLPRSTYWRHVRIPWLIFDFLIALFYFLPTYFYYPDQDLSRKLVVKNFGCIPKYINLDSLFFISTVDSTFLGTYTLMVQFFFAQIFVFAILTDIILRKQMKTTNTSRQTARLQRLFQKALILQVTLPFIVLFTPLVCAGFSVLFWLHYQYLTNVLVFLVSSHGFFSTITMISVHRPYREYTRNLVNYTIMVRIDRGNSVSNANTNDIT